MFTGLIETVGTLVESGARSNYRVLTIEAPAFEKVALGESIACDGACLTVTAVAGTRFTVEASQETAKRTTLGGYKLRDRINLERSLRVGDRMGGHFVTGHVDDRGAVDYLRPIGGSLELAVNFDPAYDRLVVEKGSVAINGVSLTINAVRAGWLSVNLIPHTAKETTLGALTSGQQVNLEFDLIGKYIARYTGHGAQAGVTAEMLLKNGW